MSNSHTFSRSQILLLNKIKGELGERIAKKDYLQNGFKIIPCRAGADFIAIKEIDTNKAYQEYVEVKTGNSRQTLTQQKTMKRIRKQKIRYSVYSITDEFLENYLINNNDHSFMIPYLCRPGYGGMKK